MHFYVALYNICNIERFTAGLISSGFMAGHHVISIPRGTCREVEWIMGIKNITQLNYVLIIFYSQNKQNEFMCVFVFPILILSFCKGHVRGSKVIIYWHFVFTQKLILNKESIQKQIKCIHIIITTSDNIKGIAEDLSEF